MLSHYSRARQDVRDGLVVAEAELDRAQHDAEVIGRLHGKLGRLSDRAHEIRERNGFEEIMQRVVQQGGTDSHGRPNGNRV